MKLWSDKICRMVGNIRQDLRILLELALEATVRILWPVIEFLLRGLSQLVKLPARCIKMFF